MKKKFGIIVLITFIIVINFSMRTISSEDKSKEIYNILLIGRDGTTNNTPSRSDTMIVLTIDEINKSLKLTSLARDTLVKIPGRGYEKLNHAYAYGKEELLIRTINENLDLNINDYAVVNFKSFIEIVNIIGGVDVTINEREINHLNKVIEACYGVVIEKNENIEYITTSGTQRLNGYQALAYARIRKLDTIYKRDERQRMILTDLAHKLSKVPISKYPVIAKSLLEHIDVNISFSKIMKLAIISQELVNYEIKQMEFPAEKYREETRMGEKGIYVIKWNEKQNKELLHRFIYN